MGLWSSARAASIAGIVICLQVLRLNGVSELCREEVLGRDVGQFCIQTFGGHRDRGLKLRLTGQLQG